MTETERWVNGACERLVASGHVRLYRDLYRDLRERLPCIEACRLIEAGLLRTRNRPGEPLIIRPWTAICDRARAVAALKRLARWAERRFILATLGRRDGQ